MTAPGEAMRDYQRRKNNEYYLPKTLYKVVLATIRDYDRMKAELQRIMDESPPPPDGLPRGSGVGQPVESVVIRRERFADKVRAIDKAFATVPQEYQAGIWNHIVRFERFPDDAHRNTYGTWKKRFIYEVAENLFLM